MPPPPPIVSTFLRLVFLVTLFQSCLVLFTFFFSLCHLSRQRLTRKLQAPRAKRPDANAKKTAAALASEAQPEATSEDEPEGDAIPKAPARVVWDKYPVHTERLLDYLDAHPDVAIRLFGDSTKVAKLEGHSKVTAKSNKATHICSLPTEFFLLMTTPPSTPTSLPTQTNMQRWSTTTSLTRKS